MASGEKLLERGVRLKTVKPKNRSVQPVEYWSPNYLGGVYQAKSEGGGVDRHQRPHWRKGHLKSQPYGPKLSLRKIIWIQPYCTGNREEKIVALGLQARPLKLAIVEKQSDQPLVATIP